MQVEHTILLTVFRDRNLKYLLYSEGWRHSRTAGPEPVRSSGGVKEEPGFHGRLEEGSENQYVKF